MSKKKSTSRVPLSRQISLIVVCSAVTGVAFMAGAPFPFIPGVIELRLASFLAGAFGILFGPIVGGISVYAGSLIWQILAGYFTVASPFSTIGEIFAAVIPAYMVRDPEDTIQVLLWSTIGGLMMVLSCSAILHVFGVLPFDFAVYLLGLADMPSIIIGTPILVKLVYRRVKAAGFAWR